VGLGEKSVSHYINLAKKQEKKQDEREWEGKERHKTIESAFVETELLIIDEISMVGWIGHSFLSRHT
jgi:hypothetical protein